MALEQSILKSTKTILGVADDDTSFDLSIMTHINAAFSKLHDLGIGPEAGYAIDDETDEWDDFLPVDDLIKAGKVKSYVYLTVRLLFDPPTSSFLMDSTEKMIQELEWRLSVNREETGWVDPDPPVPVDSEQSI